jgi:hypothetical protein
MIPQSYLKAKWWSKIFLVSALCFGALGVYLFAQLYFTNSGSGNSFIALVSNPIALGVVIAPFIGAVLLNFCSTMCDEKAQSIMEEHAKKLRRKQEKTKSKAG